MNRARARVQIFANYEPHTLTRTDVFQNDYLEEEKVDESLTIGVDSMGTREPRKQEHQQNEYSKCQQQV